MSQQTSLLAFFQSPETKEKPGPPKFKPISKLLRIRPCETTTSPPPAKKVRDFHSSKFLDANENQMIIDAGQKRFGTVHCETCDMLYEPTFAPDVAAHEEYHANYLKTPLVSIPKKVVKSVPPVQEFPDGSIFKIASPCCRSLKHAVNDLKAVLDSELGFSDGKDYWKNHRQFYLFVQQRQFVVDAAEIDARKIVGCLIIDHIKHAFRFYAEGETTIDEPVYSILGVNRIWVWKGARRRKIASRLLDCARCNFIDGYVVAKQHVAFSDPTNEGLKLAVDYFGTKNFSVYGLPGP